MYQSSSGSIVFRTINILEFYILDHLNATLVVVAPRSYFWYVRNSSIIIRSREVVPPHVRSEIRFLSGTIWVIFWGVLKQVFRWFSISSF